MILLYYCILWFIIYVIIFSKAPQTKKIFKNVGRRDFQDMAIWIDLLGRFLPFLSYCQAPPGRGSFWPTKKNVEKTGAMESEMVCQNEKSQKL